MDIKENNYQKKKRAESLYRVEFQSKVYNLKQHFKILKRFRIKHLSSEEDAQSI